MRAIVTILLVLAAIVVVALVVWLISRIKLPSDLRREIAAKDAKIRQLEQRRAELEASEPEKMRLLRQEVIDYDKLVDDILSELTTGTILQLSDVKERIAGLIQTRRPNRTF